MCRNQIADWLIDSTKQKTWNPKKVWNALDGAWNRKHVFLSAHKIITNSIITVNLGGTLARHSDHVLVNKETKLKFNSNKPEPRHAEWIKNICDDSERENWNWFDPHSQTILFYFCIHMEQFFLMPQTPTLKTNEKTRVTCCCGPTSNNNSMHQHTLMRAHS